MRRSILSGTLKLNLFLKKTDVRFIHLLFGMLCFPVLPKLVPVMFVIAKPQSRFACLQGCICGFRTNITVSIFTECLMHFIRNCPCHRLCAFTFVRGFQIRLKGKPGGLL